MLWPILPLTLQLGVAHSQKDTGIWLPVPDFPRVIVSDVSTLDVALHRRAGTLLAGHVFDFEVTAAGEGNMRRDVA